MSEHAIERGHCRASGLGLVGVLGGVFVLTVASGIDAVEAPGAPNHPSLVRVDSALCVNCHEDLVEGKAAVHEPASDDCTSCHEVSIGEEGTHVALLEIEPALCLVCHDDLARAVDAEWPTPHPPAADSCLICHDPHGTKDPKLLVGTFTEVCGGCHDPEDLAASHDGQITPSTDCTQCHRPHGSDHPRLLTSANLHRPFADGSCEGCHRAPFGDRMRLRSRGERLCTACHGAFEAPAGGTAHAALEGERGRAGCLHCHDPHMSGQRTLLHDTGPALCATCHKGVVVAANAETGHPAAADDCLACHAPHVSGQSRLLQAPRGELCVMCHDPQDEELATAHLGANPASLECTSCHDPHGAGQPHLLARNVHPPVLDGCETCHEGAADRLMEDGESTLCLICHDDIGETVEKAEFPHAALEIARCADCHNPHASARERLVKEPGGEVCTVCHEDQTAKPGEVLHGVIDLIGCQACHEPHGGGQDKLLRVVGNELCLSCHDSSRVRLAKGASAIEVLDRFRVPVGTARRMASLELTPLRPDGYEGHPVIGHRVVGSPTKKELAHTQSLFDGEMACLTCHDPHKGRSKGLFQWGAASRGEACLHCHPK